MPPRKKEKHSTETDENTSIIEAFSDRILADSDFFYDRLKERAGGITVWRKVKKPAGPAADETYEEAVDAETGETMHLYHKESNPTLLRHIVDHIVGKARARDQAAGGFVINLMHSVPSPGEVTPPDHPEPEEDDEFDVELGI